MKQMLVLMVMSAFLLVAGCASAPVGPDAVELGVDFEWQTSDRCSSRSPEIRVTNIPPATQTLKIRLKDRDVPTWNHGGGSVAYKGSGVIPAGALKNGYNGPCPPRGTHRYEFTVQALDAAGTIVGSGKRMRPFP
ncbi:MAG TPA: hypothetical protein VLT88_14960 [Desulfosarcina sp.]|nr:hypothetical protein [Desulfosarcina sp.]